jgi:hypothetical protein
MISTVNTIVDASVTAGTLQVIAAEVLGYQPGVTAAGLGNAVALNGHDRATHDAAFAIADAVRRRGEQAVVYEQWQEQGRVHIRNLRRTMRR